MPFQPHALSERTLNEFTQRLKKALRANPPPAEIRQSACQGYVAQMLGFPSWHAARQAIASSPPALVPSSALRFDLGMVNENNQAMALTWENLVEGVLLSAEPGQQRSVLADWAKTAQSHGHPVEWYQGPVALPAPLLDGVSYDSAYDFRPHEEKHARQLLQVTQGNPQGKKPLLLVDTETCDSAFYLGLAQIQAAYREAGGAVVVAIPHVLDMPSHTLGKRFLDMLGHWVVFQNTHSRGVWAHLDPLANFLGTYDAPGLHINRAAGTRISLSPPRRSA